VLRIKKKLMERITIRRRKMESDVRGAGQNKLLSIFQARNH
jgi:hypothetical protein